MKISVKFSFLVKKRVRLRWAQSRTIHNGSNHKTEWQNRGNNEILRLSKICRQKQTHYVLLYLNQSQTEKIPCGVILSKEAVPCTKYLTDIWRFWVRGKYQSQTNQSQTRRNIEVYFFLKACFCYFLGEINQFLGNIFNSILLRNIRNKTPSIVSF